MKSIILGGLAAGAITVLICTSSVGEWVRRKLAAVPYVSQLVNCCLCTSVWVSCAMLEKFSLVEWMATVSVANITVLLIHLSIATVPNEQENPAEYLEGEITARRGLHQGTNCSEAGSSLEHDFSMVEQ